VGNNVTIEGGMAAAAEPGDDNHYLPADPALQLGADPKRLSPVRFKNNGFTLKVPATNFWIRQTKQRHRQMALALRQRGNKRSLGSEILKRESQNVSLEAERNTDYGSFFPNVDFVITIIHLPCSTRCARTRSPMTMPEMSWIFDSVDAGTIRKTSPKYRVNSGILMTPVINARRNVMISPQSIK